MRKIDNIQLLLSIQIKPGELNAAYSYETTCTVISLNAMPLLAASATVVLARLMKPDTGWSARGRCKFVYVVEIISGQRFAQRASALLTGLQAWYVQHYK